MILFYLLNTALSNMCVETSGTRGIIDLSIDKASTKSFNEICATVLFIEFDETSVSSIIESIFFDILRLNLNDNRSLKLHVCFFVNLFVVFKNYL